MVKTINVTFEDGEHRLLLEEKPENLSWREWILKIAKVKKKESD